MKEILDRLSASFFIASFIPSLGFILLILLIVNPLLPPGQGTNFAMAFEPLSQQGLMVLILASILGYALASSSSFLLRLFQGEYLLERAARFTRKHWERAKKLQYEMAVQYSRQYGDLIRAAFDLFRFDLMEQPKLPYPRTSSGEYNAWRKISTFITIGKGDPIEDLSDFRYQAPQVKRKKPEI